MAATDIDDAGRMRQYREHLRRRLEGTQVPPSLWDGLIEYVAARRETGSFLKAVLSNDLRDAIMRADDDNRYLMRELVEFLIGYVPAPCWGSPAAVAAWLTSKEPVPLLFE
jgi:hypothetical protein